MIKNNTLIFDTESESGIYWLSPNIAVFPSHTNIGIIAIPSKEKPEHKDIYLIDAGPDKSVAETLYNALTVEFNDFTLKAIFDTHSHADHAGGNAEFIRRTGCKIYATQKEKSSIETPELQSAVSYGAYPLPEYMATYYLAESSTVDYVLKSDEVIKLSDDVTVECVPLPGHYFEMVGILCHVTKETGSSEKNTIFFTSDGIFTRTMLTKYWIPFLYNVEQFKDSLETIKSTKADYYVPSHGEVYTDVSGLYELNMLSVVQNEATILQCLKESPATFEDILKYIADNNDMSMRLSQFMLVGSTIRSYITYLYNQNKITWTFKSNKMYWKIKEPEEEV